MKVLLTWLFASIWASFTPSHQELNAWKPSDNGSTLIVEIHNLRSSKGQIGILVFNRDTGFPSVAEHAVYKGFIPAREGSFTFELKGLATGKIAVALMHDENNNSLLDTNILGIPKEGTGVSNNATSFFGPPEFGDCAFEFMRSGQKISVEINY